MRSAIHADLAQDVVRNRARVALALASELWNTSGLQQPPTGELVNVLLLAMDDYSDKHIYTTYYRSVLNICDLVLPGVRLIRLHLLV